MDTNRLKKNKSPGDEQHPLVYKLSSAWDSLTAESDEGIGVRELRRLDPSFSVEDWKRDIQELFLPEFMSAFLRVRERDIGWG